MSLQPPQVARPPAGAGAGGAPARKRGRRVAGEALAVLGITVLLIAGLLEGALRLFAPQIAAPIRGLFVADPVTAYRLAPGAQVAYRFAEGNTTFAINAQGLREDHDVAAPAPGSTRLLVLGDSFAFGMGVNAVQAFPQLLDGSTAADGTRVESLNAGVFGYGTDNEAAWLGKYGWPLAPKIVLVAFFVGNDVKDVMLGLDKTTATADGRLVATAKSTAALDRAGGATDPETAPATGGLKGWLENNSHAYIFVRNLVYSATGRTAKVQQPTIFDAASFFLKAQPAPITAGWSQTLGVLDGMRKDAQAHGAAFVVVAIPTREQVHDSYWREMEAQFGLRDDQLQRDLPQQKLTAWAVDTRTNLIDLLPGFRSAGPQQLLYFRTDRHWNADGQALAAAEIRQGLVRIGLLK